MGSVVFRVTASADEVPVPTWMWIEPLSAMMTIDDLESAFTNPEKKNSAGLFMEHRAEIEQSVRLKVANMRIRPDEPLMITAADLVAIVHPDIPPCAIAAASEPAAISLATQPRR